MSTPTKEPTIELTEDDIESIESRLPLVRADRQAGKIGWALLWLLGVPLPVLIIIYLLRGH